MRARAGPLWKGFDHMPTFNALYGRLVRASVKGKSEEELEKLRQEDFNPHHLDCLLNP